VAHSLDEAKAAFRAGGPLFRLGARKLDHLSPLLSFVRNKLSELPRRYGHRHAAEIGEPRPHLYNLLSALCPSQPPQVILLV